MKTTWPGFLLGPLGAKVPQTRRFCQKVRTVTPIRFVSKLRFLFGGEGGIRTLDELLTHTRVPVTRQQFEDVLLLFRFILPYLMLPVNYFLCSYGVLIVLIQNSFYSVAAGRTAELDFLKLLWYN